MLMDNKNLYKIEVAGEGKLSAVFVTEAEAPSQALAGLDEYLENVNVYGIPARRGMEYKSFRPVGPEDEQHRLRMYGGIPVQIAYLEDNPWQGVPVAVHPVSNS